MKIGLDLDNTIINYDNIFYEVAYEKNLIPKYIEKSKNAVKDYLHINGKHKDFTLIQGQVYGTFLLRAKLYEGVKSFVNFMIQKGNIIYIVSHKTKYPILGPKINMHEKALEFLNKKGIVNKFLINKDNIYFEDTLENKINKIVELNIDVFIDDLPVVISNINLLNKTKGILIDYGKKEVEGPHIKHDWTSIQKYLCKNFK